MNKHIGIILICVIVNVIFVSSILLLFCLFKTNNIEKYDDITNYTNYRQELVKSTDVHSKLKLFPKKISSNQTMEFQYYKQADLFDGAYFFHLVEKYDENFYQKEIHRLEKTSAKYEENILNYPVYIAMIDSYGTYEYAILLEENTIEYICNQLFDWSTLPVKKDKIIKYNKKIP